MPQLARDDERVEPRLRPHRRDLLALEVAGTVRYQHQAVAGRQGLQNFQGFLIQPVAAAALRALEINADTILMAKHGVEGVYDGDPRTDSNAKFLSRLTHLEAIERGLKVMDTTALSLCMDNKLSIHVFELAEGNIGRIVAGEQVGTVIETP